MIDYISPNHRRVMKNTDSLDYPRLLIEYVPKLPNGNIDLTRFIRPLVAEPSPIYNQATGLIYRWQPDYSGVNINYRVIRPDNLVGAWVGHREDDSITDGANYGLKQGLPNADNNSSIWEQLLLETPINGLILIPSGNYYFSNNLILGERSLHGKVVNGKHNCILRPTPDVYGDFLTISNTTNAKVDNIKVDTTGTTNLNNALVLTDNTGTIVNEIEIVTNSVDTNAMLIQTNLVASSYLNLSNIDIINNHQLSSNINSSGIVIVSSLFGQNGPAIANNVRLDDCVIKNHLVSINMDTVGEGIRLSKCNLVGTMASSSVGIKSVSNTTIVPVLVIGGAISNVAYAADGLIVLDQVKTSNECINGARTYRKTGLQFTDRSYGHDSLPFNQGIGLSSSVNDVNDILVGHGKRSIATGTIVPVITIPGNQTRPINGLLVMTARTTGTPTKAVYMLYHLLGYDTNYVLSPISIQGLSSISGFNVSLSNKQINITHSDPTTVELTWSFNGHSPVGLIYQ